MARTTERVDDPLPALTTFEAVFIRTVLEHKGIDGPPSLPEFTDALHVLRRYDEQRQDAPHGGECEPTFKPESIAELRAKAFLLFGTTRPTPSQWQRAHTALYGPLLCEGCS